ncbi:MAG: OmpA family protein [Planctomycetota bacterium]|nr:OmpA family protein [Planctomycetota bacterium]
MRAVALRRLLGFTLLAAFAGCAQNPLNPQGSTAALQQQQSQLALATQQLQTRNTTLDQDNQELETLLGLARQQNQLLQDQVAAVREQLTSTTQQLATLRDEKSVIEKKVQSSLASQRTRAGATINPNNSLTRNLPTFTMPGVEARPDGDVIRIELPAEKLFDPGGARLRNDAVPMVNQVVAEIERLYPGQYVGVEGHTDTEPPYVGSQWRSNHQLSTAQAQAMVDYLGDRTQIKPNQLFVVGHAGNHPVVSNGTPAGKSRNRRIELVIYPERVGN